MAAALRHLVPCTPGRAIAVLRRVVVVRASAPGEPRRQVVAVNVPCRVVRKQRGLVAAIRLARVSDAAVVSGWLQYITWSHPVAIKSNKNCSWSPYCWLQDLSPCIQQRRIPHPQKGIGRNDSAASAKRRILIAHAHSHGGGRALRHVAGQVHPGRGAFDHPAKRGATLAYSAHGLDFLAKRPFLALRVSPELRPPRFISKMHGMAQHLGGALTHEVATRTKHDDISFAKRSTMRKSGAAGLMSRVRIQ
jgi:hypothetical protein